MDILQQNLKVLSLILGRLLTVHKRKNPPEREGRGSVFQQLGQCFSPLFQLVSHIEEMLQTAYNKFHTWQSRRMLKKTWGRILYRSESKACNRVGLQPRYVQILELLQEDLQTGLLEMMLTELAHFWKRTEIKLENWGEKQGRTKMEELRRKNI